MIKKLASHERTVFRRVSTRIKGQTKEELSEEGPGKGTFQAAAPSVKRRGEKKVRPWDVAGMSKSALAV